MKRGIDAPSDYLERLKPIYNELFRMAHAIVGNLELAEYVYKSAIVEAYLRRGEWRDRMGFQEGLTHTVRAVALVELKAMRQAGSFDEDWRLPEPDAENSVYGRISGESDAMKRLIMLYYGCGLTHKQAATVMGMRPGDVSRRLNRLASKLLRSGRALGKSGRGVIEDGIETLMCDLLRLPGDDIPNMGTVFRSFERDVDGAGKPRMRASRIVAAAFKAVGAALLIVAFWVVAALLQPGATTTGVNPPVSEQSASEQNAGSPA